MLHTKYQGSMSYDFRQVAFFMFSLYKPIWQEYFPCFPCNSLCKTWRPRGGVIFGPRGIIWTNLVDVYLVILHTKYQGSRPYGFRREAFFMFSLYKPILNMWPSGQGHFWHQGHNLNKLGRCLLGDATYQISRLYVLCFQRRRFFKISSWKSIFSLCDIDM